MKLTPADIEDIYRRMETGDTTIADANAMRAYHLSLRARIDEDLKEDDEVIGDSPKGGYIFPDQVSLDEYERKIKEFYDHVLDDETIVIPPPDTNLSNHPADVPAAKKTADYDE